MTFNPLSLEDEGRGGVVVVWWGGGGGVMKVRCTRAPSITLFVINLHW